MTGAQAATVRPARTGDAEACAGILNAWIDRTAWMPRIHPPEDVVRYHRDVVLPERDVYVAEVSGTVDGFLALDKAMISALYVARPGLGLGRALLDQAKRERPDGLTLWVFQDNLGARRFYARERFAEIRRTAGDNEEGLPDLLLGWPARMPGSG